MNLKLLVFCKPSDWAVSVKKVQSSFFSRVSEMLRCCSSSVLFLWQCVSAVLASSPLVSCDSNLGLYLVHSSNGKSVSWSESGPRQPPRGGNVWHRLSVHVRKQEAGLNQTAVIRPLTNNPDPHSCKPTGCDHGTDLHHPQGPRTAKPLYSQVEEEDDEGDVQRPLWNPSLSGQMSRLESVLDKTPYLPSHLKSHTTGHLQGAAVDTHSSHVPTMNDHTHRLEASPALEPLSVTPCELPLAPPVRALEEHGSEEEELDLLQSYIYNARGEGEAQDGEMEDITQHKTTLEESFALSPPSPFRDSVCSSDSPGLESMLGSPPSPVFTSNTLQDFAHSSSTL